MPRLFCEPITRKTSSLDGAWKYKVDAEDKGEAIGWSATLTDAKRCSVPSVWNCESGLLEYEGAIFYEKSFYFEGGTLRLFFEAVMTEATVWLDGEKLGYHYGGFSSFDFIIENVAEGFHTLTVKADNRFDDNSIPQVKVDWYHYGGIIRSVSAERLVGLSVLNSKFDYTLTEDMKSASATLSLDVYNAGDKTPGEVCVSVCGFDGKFELSLAPGERKWVTLPSFEVSSIELWDTENPKLYELKITTDIDDLYDRVGFRKVEARDNKIFLNGKEIEIRGVKITPISDLRSQAQECNTILTLFVSSAVTQ